jgi:hypothetical protein
MSGSGGDTGYDYQANATAYVAAHGLAGQPLPWFESRNDVPATWSSETGGPGDDIGIVTAEGLAIEVQAKHALTRGPGFVATFQRLTAGLRSSLELRCVLLVDRHASGVIRDELKNDIARLGQGRSDELNPETVELLKDLGESPESIRELFSRLRIIVVDLDEGSDGVSAVQALLSRVVGPEKAIVAYELLGKRYRRSIKGRGQDTVPSCARFLAATVGLSAIANSPAVVTTRFAQYLRKTTETFYSPALQVRFPIEGAWNQVAPLQPDTSTLQAQIERYQEWTRLTRSSLQDDAMSAELFAEANLHSVIVAGPGAGKTTLSEKMAHVLSENMLVARVRLPMVLGMVAGGTTFDAAFARAAVDNSSFSEREGHQILATAEMLIADGLDECDPDRATAAEAISRWATSHPNAHVCVLTRPVGHSPELLPGFMHAELTPLDTHGVRRLAEQMFSQKDSVADEKRLASTFLAAIERSDTVAGIAARNPLLLSFLVALYLDGQPIEGNRAELFSRMIEQIRTAPRRQVLQTAAVDYASMWTAAKTLAWSCLEKPDRPLTELYRIVGDGLGDGPSAVRAAESAIHEWIERGLLERLTAGSRDAVVFVHLAFAEYLAGRYLADLGAADFALAIANLRRKAKWREAILLSAGVGAVDQLVATLLDLDHPEHSESTEAMLAAAAIEEAAPAPVAPALVEQVVARLKQRLPSPIPLVAIDGALPYWPLLA